MKPKKSLIFLSTLFIFLAGCQHVALKPQRAVTGGEKSLIKRDIAIVSVPENKSTPAYITFTQKDRLVFGAMVNTSGYRIEANVDPLMRNFAMVAKIEKNGKVVREFLAKKNATAVLSDKKTTWSPTRSKMVVTIPYLAEGEEVVVDTSYEWMDMRWMPPIFLQEDAQGAQTSVMVDVAYGTTMHFKASKDRFAHEFIPENEPHENKLWVDQDNKAGLGLRYRWQSMPDQQSRSSFKADLLQLYFAFDAPSRNEVTARFDSWPAISTYLYNRIDRYDMPSSEVRASAIEKTKNAKNDKEKVDIILSFLKNDIEKRSAVGPFNEQPVQPATRTFARRYGSAFDLVILGQAMLSSLGLNSNILLSADQSVNPKLTDFYSPALFTSPVLAINLSGSTFYFDPEATNPQGLSKNLQGQLALTLMPLKGEHLMLPFDTAQKHGTIETYQLWLNDNDALEGEYSVDLSGFETEGFALEPGMTDPQATEAKLRQKNELLFSLASAEVIKNKANPDSVRLYGEIRPELLSKNADSTLELKLEKIVGTLVSAFKSARSRNYSFTKKIALFLNLPDKMVAKNIPPSINLNAEGIQGRFSVSNLGNELVIEGIAMISMPIVKSDDKLNESLKGLMGLGEKSLSLGSVALGEFDAQDHAENPLSP